MPDRPYLFLDLTISLCNECLRRVEAKVIIQDDKVYLLKYCPQHKHQKVLISTDPAYYKKSRDFIKPGQMPKQFNTPTEWGCPYDCGLCPDHEQHGCLTLIEVTDHCNLQCPICYSESSPHRPTHRSLEQIEFMLDCVVRNEGEPDIVQISGGEPTIHPQFWEILDAAKARPIKHLMLNTNGVKIADDPEFAARLADYLPNFEIYLQFDSLDANPQIELRGLDLTKTRQRALARLNEHNISTTLVVTLKKGLNDDQIGDIIDFALKQPCVRGVTFQPIQIAGRVDNFDPAKDRLTLSEIRQQILDQSKTFAPNDIIPVPCHPDCLAMGYALKVDGQAIALTSLLDPQVFLEGAGNSIVYEQNSDIRDALLNLFSTSSTPQSSSENFKQLLCCLPHVAVPEGMNYNNIFRVFIMQFLDPYNFDVRSVKRACVHIVHPDGRIIPFDTFNMFYRDQKQETLTQLRVLQKSEKRL
jgi:uncharacterized radical SAM superfamily Fe-S cluster-containing enzyme